MNPATPFLCPRGATWFVAAVLAAFAAAAAFSVLDHPRAAGLEAFSQTTAAGDRHYYRPPHPPLAIPEPVFTWQGRPWAPALEDKLKIDDPEMRRVGRDEATGLSIYQPASGKPPGYFIKIDPGEFIRLQPR